MMSLCGVKIETQRNRYMLKRKITQDLINWKNNPDRFCLIVKGARQIGKTYSIRSFAKEYYQNIIEINFYENRDYLDIFAGSLTVDNIIKQISLRFSDVNIVPGHTLIFLDEIQECPKARTALKFLSMDQRVDVIASGSMLGINYQDVVSYPVGYVDQIEMYSLDFEEFLWANNIKADSISDIKNFYLNMEVVPKSMHSRMLELFREYIVVGGMPRVVSVFVKEHNFSQVLRMQRNIISNYLDDIAKYAENSEKIKARDCFLSIPKHLAKDYKKFRYSLVRQGGSARKYGGSLMWLHDAGIISFCHNLAIPELPLEGNAKSEEFKVYMRDTGLLMAMLEDGSQIDIIDGNLGIYKGAIYENVIADIFVKSGKKLYYFEKDNRLEIDFFIRRNRKSTAVEVKSADNTKSKSLNRVIELYQINGIKLSAKNIAQLDNVEILPIYMAMFL